MNKDYQDYLEFGKQFIEFKRIQASIDKAKDSILMGCFMLVVGIVLNVCFGFVSFYPLMLFPLFLIVFGIWQIKTNKKELENARRVKTEYRE